MDSSIVPQQWAPVTLLTLLTHEMRTERMRQNAQLLAIKWGDTEEKSRVCFLTLSVTLVPRRIRVSWAPSVPTAPKQSTYHHATLRVRVLHFPKGAPHFMRFIFQVAGPSHTPPPTHLTADQSIKFEGQHLHWTIWFEFGKHRTERQKGWAGSHSPFESRLQWKHCLLTLTRSENGEKEKKREKQMHLWHSFQLIVCHESKSQLPC